VSSVGGVWLRSFDLELRVSNSRFRVRSLGYEIPGVQGLGFRFRVWYQGSGFGV
jgi:hypothetical protein